MATIEENREMWTNLHDWNTSGEEWSVAWGGSDMQFYGSIFPRIRQYLPANKILEIATGKGRWTQYLIKHCSSFTGVDLVEECAEYCRRRFAEERAEINFYSNDGTKLDFVDNHSIDFVFSYDSLVHVDIEVLQSYLQELNHKLSSNGVAFIHHSNFNVFNNDVPNVHWRDTTVSHLKIKDICDEIGLSVVSQELLNWGSNYLSDCFSVITRRGSRHDKKYSLIENPSFMREADYLKTLAGVYRSDRNPIPRFPNYALGVAGLSGDMHSPAAQMARIVEKVFESRIDEVIIFGAGDMGKTLIEQLLNVDIKVPFLVDNNERLWGTSIKGVEVGPVSKLIDTNVVSVAIASKAYISEIETFLLEYGKLNNKRFEVISCD